MTEEPLCFVAERGVSWLYCRKAFPSAVSALSAGALLCQPSCFCHGACSPPLDLGSEAKQLCESRERYRKEGKP